MQYEVKPFPKEWCSGCMLNGCYPWNRNPLLLCMKMGGLGLQMSEIDEKGEEICCLTSKPVTKDIWEAHLTDLKNEAELNEECRLRAMHGKLFSSDLLPAEYIQRRLSGQE